MLKNITIRRKLLISFVTMTIFIMVLSFLSGLFLIQVRNENNNLYNHPFQVSNAVKQTELDIRTLNTIMQELVFNNDDGSKTSSIEAQILVIEQDLEANLDIIEENYLGDMNDVALLKQYYESSKESRDTLVDYIGNNQFTEAKSLMSNQGIVLRDKIFTQTEIINTFAENKAIELRESVDNHTRNYIISIVSISIFLVLITIYGFTVMMKDIYPPIEKLMTTIDSYKKGQNENTLDLSRGDEIGVVSNTLNDMIAYLKTQQELNEISLRLENVKNQELLRVTLQSIGEAVITTDLENKITDINQVALHLTGFEREHAIGLSLNEVFKIVHSKTRKQLTDIKKYQDQLEHSKDRHHIILISKSKEEYYIEASVSAIVDEENTLYGSVVIFRNITQEIKRQERIEFLSENDVLTKLRNRNYLEKKLLELEESKSLNIGIFMGDVNGLKIANDAFGHTFGDELLVQISEILIESTKGFTSTIVRWGGDEFVIVLEDVNKDDLESLYKTIRFNAENYKTSNPVGPNISLGYALKSSEDQNLYRTLIRAEDKMYENKLVEKNSNRSKIVSTLENSLYEKSFETEEHALRVAKFSRNIAMELGLSENEINQIELLGKLHDIGKISIDDTVLKKEGVLDDSEWNIIKRHPEIGYRIASSLSELTHIADGILNHHERYDGTGYPRGLKGDEIPLASRIIAVADAFDVMTSERPYKKTFTKEVACKELRNCSGTQFDPEIVDIFIEKACKLEEH